MRAAFPQLGAATDATPTDATAKIAIAASKIGRLPHRSDSGPMMICNTAEIARYPAIDRFTIQYSTSNSRAIFDKDGKNIFSERTEMAVKKTSKKRV